MPETLRGTFQSLVSRPDTHVVLDIEGTAPVLLVLFGGIAGGVSMPVFEFFNLTAEMPGKKAFLRDPLRGWYQRGIPGIGSSAEDVRDYLNSVIDRSGVERVVMAGASAGGFAALLFGTWCKAAEVLAFSPQTFIDAAHRAAFADERWREQIDELHTACLGKNAVFDIIPVLADASKTRCQIHVSTDDVLDIAHAHRIASCPGVEIFEHQDGGHRLVKTLRDRGLLQPMLLSALAGG